MTQATAGNALASTALAASGTTSFTVDLSAKWEGQVMVKVTMGATVAATAGVMVEVFMDYVGGATPTWSTVNPNFTYTVAAGAASAVVYSPIIFLPTGRYQVKLTNLDATNGVTAEASLGTVDSVA